MVSRYVPDMGDLIWVDFDPTKGSEQAVVLSGQERDGVALADQVKSIAWRARGATKKGTVAPEELQLIKAKINVLIG